MTDPTAVEQVGAAEEVGSAETPPSLTDAEAAGRAAIRDAAAAWRAYWSGLIDCPYSRVPVRDPALVRAWFAGHDAELRQQRQVWLSEAGRP